MAPLSDKSPRRGLRARVTTRCDRHIGVFTVAALLLSACGGGGDSSGSSGGGPPPPSGVSMSVSPLSISVTATTAQSAPTGSVQVSITAAQQGQQIYLSGKYSESGIDSISATSGASPITVTVQFKTPAALGAGVYHDQVQLSGCYDQACTEPVSNSPQTVQTTYTITDTFVKVSSLSPASAVAGGPAFVLTVTGVNFTPQSTVLWNGSPRTTTYVSGTQLTAQIGTGDITSAGAVPVSVNDPSNGASGPINFTVGPGTLGLTSVSPTAVSVGGPSFMLTVLGAGFSATSTVQWNGAALATTFVASYELIAQVPATDIATLGTAAVTVHDPSSTVGTTQPQTVTIAAVSKDAVAFQINPAHTGAVNFASVSLPASAAWSVDVGGTASYALIAQGNVYVTVTLSGGSSQLLALDQVTGATVWGPVVIGGSANAAYDSGKLFVISSTIGTAATIEAFDAGTGHLVWSTLLAGQYWFSAAPTAANGMVYTGGAGSGGTLYALDQATGNIVWTQGVENGDNSTPAVTADGVYVTYPCWTYDFRPATGESIWNNNTGCEGGGGATPVVANQQVYSPNGTSGYNGSVYDAETGAPGVSYVADSPGAFTANTGFFLQSGTLRGVTLSNNSVIWSFAGDGHLAGSPIAVNQYVFIGSSSGNLYALNGATGVQAWQVTLGAPVVANIYTLPLSALSAGDGLLVVPAGTKVTAYVLSANP
jgi:outer membrane protein assembly factor BamB